MSTKGGQNVQKSVHMVYKWPLSNYKKCIFRRTFKTLFHLQISKIWNNFQYQKMNRRYKLQFKSHKWGKFEFEHRQLISKYGLILYYLQTPGLTFYRLLNRWRPQKLRHLLVCMTDIFCISVTLHNNGWLWYAWRYNCGNLEATNPISN